MSVFSILNKNEKDNNKQLTLEEKWSNDFKSYIKSKYYKFK